MKKLLQRCPVSALVCVACGIQAQAGVLTSVVPGVYRYRTKVTYEVEVYTGGDPLLFRYPLEGTADVIVGNRRAQADGSGLLEAPMEIMMRETGYEEYFNPQSEEWVRTINDILVETGDGRANLQAQGPRAWRWSPGEVKELGEAGAFAQLRFNRIFEATVTGYTQLHPRIEVHNEQPWLLVNQPVDTMPPPSDTLWGVDPLPLPLYDASGTQVGAIVGIPHDYEITLIGKPGDAPDLPVLPDDFEGHWFIFPPLPVDPWDIIYLDPPIAVGYEYEVIAGPNFGTVLVPNALPNGDATFELLFAGFSETLEAGVEFNITDLVPGGVDKFTILGIDPAEVLDATDTTAFPVGVGYVAGGISETRFQPIAVPEPSTILLAVSAGAFAAGIRRRRRRARASRRGGPR